MGDTCQICGAEPAFDVQLLGLRAVEGSQIEAQPTIVIRVCGRHWNALLFDVGRCIGNAIRRHDAERAAPSSRAETGAMQFGDDWRGLFIRGDNAFHFSVHLGSLLEYLRTEKVINPIVIAVLEGLHSLLMSASEQTKVAAQLLRPFDECVAPAGGSDA